MLPTQQSAVPVSEMRLLTGIAGTAATLRTLIESRTPIVQGNRLAGPAAAIMLYAVNGSFRQHCFDRWMVYLTLARIQISRAMIGSSRGLGRFAISGRSLCRLNVTAYY